MAEKNDFEILEARYAQMGELLLGSVRCFEENSWHWMDGDAICIYAKDPASNLRMLQVITPTEEGGVSGRGFLFTDASILKATRTVLSAAEYHQPDMQRYVRELHEFEEEFGTEPEITKEDQEEFWRALFAPIEE